MKKVLSALLLAFALVTGTVALSGCGSEKKPEGTKVYVTIANGELALSQAEVYVQDKNSDGTLSIDETLYAAHEQYYKGGAEAGYASAEGQFGLGLTKLWGVEKGSSYGYYVNNVSAMSLADAVAEGSYVNAFVYTDETAWTDRYCWFDKNTVNGKEAELTLMGASFDENFNFVPTPVAGAVILIDGKETEFVTDAEGKVTVKLNGKKAVISAKSANEILVPPVCIAGK